MLPEALSNMRCSLMPGVPRRAVVMAFKLDATGQVLNSRISRQIITSAARLTYREVADFLQTETSETEVDRAVPRNLRALFEVYKLLALRRKDMDAHKLVEELMLLANQEAAHLLVKRYGVGVFRHQPQPAAEAWGLLQQWAKDHSFALGDVPSLKAMADLVNAMPEGEVRAAAIMKVRMCMQPARYMTMSGAELSERGGHFSLCASAYTHFTSPIRRYADLLVHRLLLAPAGTTLSDEELQALRAAVAQIADRSMASRLSERLMWDRLKLKGFLEEHERADVLPARVVRITPRGFRVVLSGWQLAAWLPGSILRQEGYSKDANDVWMRGVGTEAKPVREGALLQVSWTDVNLERPAYPELQVKLAQVG
jgi:ribonuclease R